MEECSFKPTLDPTSLALAERTPRREVPLHEPVRRHSLIQDDAPATPEINEISRILVEMKGDRNEPVHERLLNYGQEAQARHAREAKEKMQKEVESLTHSPQIDKNSEKLVRKRQGAQ
eukprot:828286-Rhodomonas_salina.1